MKLILIVTMSVLLFFGCSGPDLTEPEIFIPDYGELLIGTWDLYFIDMQVLPLYEVLIDTLTFYTDGTYESDGLHQLFLEDGYWVIYGDFIYIHRSPVLYEISFVDPRTCYLKRSDDELFILYKWITR